jgi:hypothetical protein
LFLLKHPEGESTLPYQNGAVPLVMCLLAGFFLLTRVRRESKDRVILGIIYFPLMIVAVIIYSLFLFGFGPGQSL